jgi:hypothetical protein
MSDYCFLIWPCGVLSRIAHNRTLYATYAASPPELIQIETLSCGGEFGASNPLPDERVRNAPGYVA